MKVKVGNLDSQVGYVKLKAEPDYARTIAGVVVPVTVILITVIIVTLVILKRRGHFILSRKKDHDSSSDRLSALTGSRYVAGK